MSTVTAVARVPLRRPKSRRRLGAFPDKQDRWYFNADLNGFVTFWLYHNDMECVQPLQAGRLRAMARVQLRLLALMIAFCSCNPALTGQNTEET